MSAATVACPGATCWRLMTWRWWQTWDENHRKSVWRTLCKDGIPAGQSMALDPRGQTACVAWTNPTDTDRWNERDHPMWPWRDEKNHVMSRSENYDPWHLKLNRHVKQKLANLKRELESKFEEIIQNAAQREWDVKIVKSSKNLRIFIPWSHCMITKCC